MARTRLAIMAAAGFAVAFALVSCSAAPMPTPTPTPTVSAIPLPPGDGVFTVGTAFPTSGALAFIAPAQVAGVELAVREINEAGGVLGVPVQVFHRDSGEATTDKFEESFADLVDKKTDVLIGPSSSVLAERILPKAIEAGMAVISPAATSPRLSELDDRSFLFRTISSAALQGSVLAEVINKDKQAKIAIVYFDDASGTAVQKALTDAVADGDGKLAASEAFTAKTTDFAPLLAAVKASRPDAVVLASPFSAMEQNKAIITQLTADGLGKEKLWLTSGNLADYSQALPAGMLTGAHGILEGAEPDAAFTARVKSMNPAVTDFRYAAEAYDATILAALAAIVAANDSGTAVAQQLRETSAGGIKCLSFAECLDVLTAQDDIDYDGVSGPLNLSASGDPRPAHYGVYQYTAENKFSRVDGVVGG